MVPIKLYTDSIGASFYQRFGLLNLYDEVNINFLNNYSKSNIDAAYFWTSGKINCFIKSNRTIYIFRPGYDY